MAWDGWHLTVIRNGVPWDVQTFDFTAGGPNTAPDGNTLSGQRMVISADGLEAIICGTRLDPYIVAYSTVTGEQVWDHSVYSVDGQGRGGTLLGSPCAGRYLWRDDSWSGLTMTSAYDINAGTFADFGPFPDGRTANSIRLRVTARWLDDKNVYPYAPSPYFQNGCTAVTSWDGSHTTDYYYPGTQEGNFGVNPNYVYDPNGWEQTVWFIPGDIAMPPQTGNSATLSVIGSYSSYWNITSARLDIYYPALGTADSTVIELRDQTGAVLDTIIDDASSLGEQWLPMQSGINAYVRYTSGGIQAG
jgi:hypothetical protein